MILESGLCEVSRHLTQRARGATWGEGEDLGANSMSWLLHIEESPAKMIGEQFGGNLHVRRERDYYHCLTRSFQYSIT